MVASKARQDVSIKDTKNVEIGQVGRFCYLGSILSEQGGCREEIDARISSAWRKWRDVSGVVCDIKMPLKLKIKIYTAVIRPVLLYGSETAALKRQKEPLK